MEKILVTPGLRHLARKIFLHLDFEDLMSCKKINTAAREILEDPDFCKKKGMLNVKDILYYGQIHTIGKNGDLKLSLFYYYWFLCIHILPFYPLADAVYKKGNDATCKYQKTHNGGTVLVEEHAFR